MCKCKSKMWKRKAKNRKVRFGAKGTKALEFLGDLPQNFVGVYTRELYNWTAERPELDVDRRDVPGLGRVLGRENFRETAAN